MDLQRTLYVTHLEKEGPYIKIWGQTDRNMPIAIEKTLQQVTLQFEQGLFVPALTEFYAGLMCCAKFKDGNYYRAKVTSTAYVEQGMVEVLFLDYGNKDTIPCGNIRTPANSLQLLSLAPQSKDFILAEVAMPVWDLSSFEAIANELRYLELEIVPICEIGPFVLIRLLSHKEDVTVNLLNRGLIIKVTVQSQQQTLQQYLQTAGRIQPLIVQPVPPAMVPVKIASPTSPISSMPTILSYKAMPLENGSEHDVYVSYVSDGPCLFSVQLQKLEGLLKRLMTEINSIDLIPLDEYPLPGTVCLAQSSEDGYICRAVVTSMVDGEYKVFYVDFGNTEILQFAKLFQIPVKYVIPKVMATRFALSGLETANVSIEMKCAFKDFVNNKLLRMQVKPAAAKSALPLCELWDELGIKAIDIIRQSALLSYPEPVPLPRGFSQEVRVSYVCSCNKFYVQLKSKEAELGNLMNILSATCENRPLLDEENLRPGSPCYALYTDGVWYRAQIVNCTQGVMVKYIDYGNEELVPIENLREPVSEHVFVLRPQAIECCLNGYQNIEPDTQRDGLLEELIVEQEFTMKVVEMQSNRALVELFDNAHYNVASLLLDKVASATSQVSPLLIQDNHQFEHRKRTPPQNYKDKRPLRELNERNTEADNWRQNSSSRNQQRDGHDSSDSKESFYTQRDRGANSFHARGGDGGGHEKNVHQRGLKRGLDGPRKRAERTEENGNSSGGEWNRDGGNVENRTFARRDRRNDDQRQDNFQQNRFTDRLQRQPRGSGFQRNDEDQPKRYNRNSDFSRDDDRPRRFNRNQDFQRDDDNQGKRFGRGQDFQKNDDRPKRFNRYEDKGSGDTYRNKRNEFRREPSERSSSDTSERSWKKSPRPRQTDGKGKSFKRSPNASEVITSIDNFSKGDENWGDNSQPVTSTSPPIEENLILAVATDCFRIVENLLNQTENISVSWFYNPQYFYVQLEKSKKEFRSMMEEIQTRYKKRKTITPVVGQSVIALFPEDKVLYRAQVLNCNLNRYQVRYIDYGNTATVDKIYAIETKYMELPAQAICCSLDRIVPPNENWLEPDNYSLYFDKNTFSGTFTSTFDANMYYVDLISEGISVSEKLLGASLAVLPHSDFDLNMLFGQQMMVLVKEVQSLSSIKIELEPNLGVDAAMHNLTAATETFEDDLKAWIGSFVIMYVDNVEDNKLEVTFYDMTGQKLKIIVPDEGAYDTIVPLSPLPIYTKTLYGLVCHATPTSIFLQPSRLEQTLVQLLDVMFNHYETAEPDESLTPEIDGIYAVRSGDSNWYRGKIVKISEEAEGDIEVSYLDYGNTENVKVGGLRFLVADFFQTHMLAVEVKVLDCDCEKYHNFEVNIEVQYEEDGWVGKIVEENEEGPIETNENLIETPKNEVIENQQEVIESQDTTIATTQQETSEEIDQKPEPIENQQPEIIYQGVCVTLSHSDSPSEFYLQLSDDVESIEALQAELQLQIPSLTNLENPAPGSLCAAPFSLDNQWYRAQILDADDDITTVRFIDYGNTDVIDNKTTSIKTLPIDMLTTEYHAKLCSLYVKPLSFEWSTSAIEKYEQFLGDKNLRAEIIHQDEKTTYVELFANNENVALFLKNENLATDLQLETETSSTGFISHLNSPSEFWMQLESSVPDLEWVAEQLTNASNFPVLQDLTPGSLCAAIFPEDESWYRARILSNTVAGIEVIFIDYGNSFSCMELRELPEDLVMLSPLAMKSSLQKPTGILQWSSKATEKFNEISADGATVFNVNILTTGETSVVQLTVDSEDVSYQLLPETKDCRISYFNTIDEFWIQLVENDSKLREIETSLINITSLPDVEDPKINDLIATIYEESWYRAKILKNIGEGFNVLFIDYGNEAVITSNLKKLTNDCDKTDALAKCYKLEVLPRTKWAEDSTDKFREINKEGTIFQLEEVSESTTRLYLNGEDIRIILGTVKCSPIPSAQSSPKKAQSKESHSETLDLKESCKTEEKQCLKSVEATEGKPVENIENPVQSNIEDVQVSKPQENTPLKPTNEEKEELELTINPTITSIEICDRTISPEIQELKTCKEETRKDELQKSKSLEDFGNPNQHNQTISDTSQPDLDENTSLDTSKDSDTSLKFIEGIASEICEKAAEEKSNEPEDKQTFIDSKEEVPKDKLVSEDETQKISNDSTTKETTTKEDVTEEIKEQKDEVIP